MNGSNKFADIFAEMLEIRYSQFRIIETSPTDVTNRADMIVKLARATRNKKGGLRAIQEVLDRIDGKVAKKIEVILPKFYYRYPYADSVAVDGGGTRAIEGNGKSASLSTEVIEDKEEIIGSLRDTVEKLLDRPKTERLKIIRAADEIDKFGVSEFGDPKLKSVIAASLYDLMDYNLGAIYELLEQIEGKVADKIEVVGNDIHMNRYDKVAPAGAVRGKDGVYELLAENTTDAWAARLDDGKNSRTR